MCSSTTDVGKAEFGDGMDPEDREMLDRLQKTAFDSLAKSTNPRTGLVADRSLDDSDASIAVVGFALSCYPVAAERGWLPRADAAARAFTIDTPLDRIGRRTPAAALAASTSTPRLSTSAP